MAGLSFIWGGFELNNHTLHSLARNLITRNRKAAILSVSILNLNFHQFNIVINKY